MCGTVGLYERDQPEKTPAPDLLDAMTDALRHRGPDGRGVRIAPGVGFGHHRLTILDPNPCRQPADGGSRREGVADVQRRDLQLPGAPEGARVRGTSFGPGPTPRWCCALMSNGAWIACIDSTVSSRSLFGTAAIGGCGWCGILSGSNRSSTRSSTDASASLRKSRLFGKTPT